MADRPSKWNSGMPETPCGKGAKLSETMLIREWLPEVVAEYKIKSIADVGCGDQNWMRHVNFEGNIQYQGFDNEPIDVDIIKFDCTKDFLPSSFDAIVCIYVLNHLYGSGDVKRAIQNFQDSGSRYLIATYNDIDDFPLSPIDSVFHKEKISARILRRWYYGVFEL